MNLRKSVMGVIGIGLIAVPCLAASPHALPLQESLEKARVDGKYAMLLRQIKVEKDFEKYGAFRDAGPRTATDYAGLHALPAGHWVYVYPYWYIWRNLAQTLAPSALGAGASNGAARHTPRRRLHDRVGVVDAGRPGRMAPAGIRQAGPPHSDTRSRDLQPRRTAARDGVQARRRGSGIMERCRPDGPEGRQRRIGNCGQDRI